ncbi:phospholipase D-like domain-containing protein [Rhizobium sp. WSM1274]|uniref:phospholipase D-like domain-containing protein n=1 Tax=Rhizobium sp. WSM1274 TaxID=3138254 RepID=UPI0021A3BB86|nr:phospholipase D-like domain-containing protein [Rhizobium leguminosarum]UWU27284.1 phospholipase D-like domain-containing protein [Rhizobium leguminosarum bv. viciae]
MRAVHIIFPVLRGARKFKIEKGRRWSVIEHLILQALATRPRSARELSEDSGGLPRRVIIEAITRLMRAGWVELLSSGSTVVFDATNIGKARSVDQELPSAITPTNKWRSFQIDAHTGAAFRVGDLTTLHYNAVPQTTDEQIVHFLDRPAIESEDLGEIFNAIEGQDELIVGVHPSATRLSRTNGIVTYRHGVPEGIPSKAPKAFVDFIENEYAKVRELEKTLPEPSRPAVAAATRESSDNSYLFDNTDLILDGKGHEEALSKLIKSADTRILIHSGFVTTNVDAVLPKLLAAAGRSVRIDLFYGQDEAEGARTSSELAIEHLKKKIAGTGVREMFHIHPFSTESHSKIAIADDRQAGWTAIVGSCNWLAADYKSFDASVRLRDPRLVGQLLKILGKMAKGRVGVWNDTNVAGLFVLGRSVERLPAKGGRKAQIDLLFTGDHAPLVMEAARMARERVFVLSHQFGIAGRPVTIFPLMDSAKSSGIDVSVFYGKSSGKRGAGKMTAEELLDLRQRYGEAGLVLRSVERPRLHAKVLGWDRDEIAITSFNWLSVDPNDQKPLREIGVRIKSNRIAEQFLQDFDRAQW